MTDDEGLTQVFFSKNPDEFKIHLKNSHPWGSIKLYKAKFRFLDDYDIPYRNIKYCAVSDISKLVYFGITEDKGETEV